MENTEKMEVVETAVEQKPADVLPDPAIKKDPVKEEVSQDVIEPKEYSRVLDATKASFSVFL